MGAGGGGGNDCRGSGYVATVEEVKVVFWVLVRETLEDMKAVKVAGVAWSRRWSWGQGGGVGVQLEEKIRAKVVVVVCRRRWRYCRRSRGPVDVAPHSLLVLFILSCSQLELRKNDLENHFMFVIADYGM